MDYQSIMNILSQSGLGSALLTKDHIIINCNDTGKRLLHSDRPVEGQSMLKLAGELCSESELPVYARVAFGEYLVRCPAPEAEDLPENTYLLVFRSATGDAVCDMLMTVVNHLEESVILCDEKNRIFMLNDAAVQMDSIVTSDVMGDDVANVYHAVDGANLKLPEAIEKQQPSINQRQYYTTRYGKNVDIVASTYPIIQNGQTLGAFSVMQDSSTVDSLHKQIIDLQEKLVTHPKSTKNKSQSALSAKYTFNDIIHVSDSMQSVIAQCRQVAKSDSSVMIYGETGTGKELFAQSIHNASRRSKNPFLAINCAAIPDNLLEGLLFGTEKGAYTGAESRAGLFEQANTGTLLLDEINSMNIGLQTKLLRVLQDGMIRRVGGSAEIRVDVRVLSNINMRPDLAIEQNILRQDLFYRLGVVNISLPPLQERKEDIPLLAKHFILQYNKKMHRTIRDVDNATMEIFRRYSWPGNVRELQHTIEHAMNILPDDRTMITPQYLPYSIIRDCRMQNSEERKHTPSEEESKIGGSYSKTVKGLQYEIIVNALKESGGNISQAARLLKMSRQNLQYHIRKYQLDPKNLPE